MEEASLTFASPLFAPALDGVYQLPDAIGRLSVFTRRGRHQDTDRAGMQMLFVDDIWPASYCISDYLVQNRHLVKGKRVVELGAGAGLPSCVAAKLGAMHVVATDYPASNVIENLTDVFAVNVIDNASAASYKWGEDASPLLAIKRSPDDSSIMEQRFDLILMADLFWKDTYQFHRNILDSIKKLSPSSLSSDPICLVAFAHRPTESHPPSKDLEFFKLASEEYNYDCRFIDVCNKYGDNTDCDIKMAEVFLYALYNAS